MPIKKENLLKFLRKTKDKTLATLTAASSIAPLLFKEAKDVIKGERKIQLPTVLRVAALLLIIYQAFFPAIVFKLTIGLIVILILIIVGILVLAYFTGAASVQSFLTASDILIPIILILLLLGFIRSLGSPEYYRYLRPPAGIIAFLVGVAIAIIIGISIRRTLSFLIVSGLFVLLLFFIIPLALATPKTVKYCPRQLPFIGKYCPPLREVKIEIPETVKVPVSGGISFTFGSQETGYKPPETLFAGEPYEYSFVMKNYYEEPITFSLQLGGLIFYGGHIIEFSYPFKQKTNTLKVNDFYQDDVFIDPKDITLTSGRCPYIAKLIADFHKINKSEVECAKDKPCLSLRGEKTCVVSGYFECECADWNDLTCRGADISLKAMIHHTGFFRGTTSLYYYEKYGKPVQPEELIQGPLSVIVYLFPNPYVKSLHEYRDKVRMSLVLRNRGGDIKITSFSVKPLNTIVRTVDREKNLEMKEEIGMQVISCKDLAGLELPGGTEIEKHVCDLTPPYVSVSVTDQLSGETIVLNDVTFDRIRNYCEREEVQTTPTGAFTWSTNWENIYRTIGESGICELLEKDTEESKTIESSFRVAKLLIELRYEIDKNVTSTKIKPYTFTETCVELAGGEEMLS